MALNGTHQIPLAVAQNDTIICLTGQSLDTTTISSVSKVDKMGLWEKLFELSKIPAERAKMRPNLLKICDKVMIKKSRHRNRFFTEVDVRFFLITGEAFYKRNIRKDLNATGARKQTAGTLNGIVPWPHAERLGL